MNSSNIKLNEVNLFNSFNRNIGGIKVKNDQIVFYDNVGNQTINLTKLISSTNTQWDTNQNELFSTQNVNIGSSTSLNNNTKLDVNGSVHIENDLYIGGVIKDKNGNALNLGSVQNPFESMNSKPSAPTLKSSFSTKTEVGIEITPPVQTPFGNMLLPYIDTMCIELVDLNGVNPNLVIAETSHHLPNSETPLTRIILNRVLNGGNYNERNFGNEENVYVLTYGTTNIYEYIKNGKFKLCIWYDNTNLKTGSLNKLEVEIPAFLLVTPPPPPTITNIGITSTSLSFNVNDESEFPLSQLEYTVTPISSKQYSFDGAVITRSVPYTSSLLIEGLDPATEYEVFVKVKSVIPGIGFSSSSNTLLLRTNNPTNVSFETLNIALTPSEYDKYVYQQGTKPVTNKVYNKEKEYFLTLTDVPIQDNTNPGSTASDLCTVTIRDEETIIYQSKFGGFGVDSIETINTGHLTLMEEVKSQTNPEKYYNYIERLKFKFNLGVFENDSINLSIEVDVEGDVRTFTETVYIETLNVSPTITRLDIDYSNLSSKMVTGLTVYGNQTPEQISYSLIAQNIATNFYKQNLFEFSSGSNIIINNLTDTTMSSLEYPLEKDNDIYFDGNMNLTFGNLFSRTLHVTSKINSLFNNSFNQYQTILPILVDTYSYNKNFPSSITFCNTDSEAYRLKSQSVLNIDTSFVNYDHTVSLLESLYINEIPVIQGKYSFAGLSSLSSSTNYTGPDYSSILNETGFRYATFVWKISTTLGSIKNLSFVFDQFNGNNKLTRNSANSQIESNYFKLQYRFEETRGGVVQTPSNDNYSSYWIDGLKYNGNSFTPNDSSRNGTMGGIIFSDSDITPDNDPTSPNFTCKVTSYSFKPSSYSNTQVRVYLRVGMYVHSGISFANVKCVYN